MAATGPSPLRRLLPLAGVVFAVHVALLQARPGTTSAAVEKPPPAFAIRTIDDVAPAPASEAKPRAEAVGPLPSAASPARAPRAVSVARPAVEAATSPLALTEIAAPPPPSQPIAAAQQASTAATGTAAAVPAPAHGALPVVLPPPARLRYEVTAQTHGLQFSGHAVLDWRHDGAQYEASLELGGPLLPTRTQRSRGRITDEGLAPDYFADRGRGEQATHFDRVHGRLVFSNNRPEAALPAGIQDRLSVVLQLAAMVAGQPARFTAGHQFEIPTASTREAEAWLFRVEGEEDLQLPGGAVRALKLQRLPRREFDQKVELWLAPGQDYAPVRLRLTNPNGDTVDQRWASTDRG